MCVRQEMPRRSALSLRLRSRVSRDTEVVMPATMAAGMVTCTGSAGKAAVRANSVERSPSEQPIRHRRVLTPARRQWGGDCQKASDVGAGAGAAGGGGFGEVGEDDFFEQQDDEDDEDEDVEVVTNARACSRASGLPARPSASGTRFILLPSKK